MKIIPSSNYFPADPSYLRKSSNAVSTEELRKREAFHAARRSLRSRVKSYEAVSFSQSFKEEIPKLPKSRSGPNSQWGEKVHASVYWIPTLDEQRYERRVVHSEYRYEMQEKIPRTDIAHWNGNILIQAAKCGDLVKVLTCILCKDQLELHPNDWGKAVCIAIKYGHREIVQALANDAMFSREERGHAVWLAAERGLLGFLHVLLAGDAKIDEKDRQLGVRLAGFHNHPLVGKFLLANKKQLSEELRSEACQEQFWKILQELKNLRRELSPKQFSELVETIRIQFPFFETMSFVSESQKSKQQKEVLCESKKLG